MSNFVFSAIVMNRSFVRAFPHTSLTKNKLAAMQREMVANAFCSLMLVLLGSICLWVTNAHARDRDVRPPSDVRDQEAVEWLERISKAARELPYSGVFVHQTVDNSSTSRVTHLLDRQGVEHEKIEALDGPMHEIIRRNEEMFCYQPDLKIVRVDRRASGRFFPSLITGNPKLVSENYRVKMGPIERIAGFDCQWLTLEPKDEMRYAQKLCAEVGTGLLLRARTYNDRSQLLEQFMFTQLDVNRSVAKTGIKSRYEQNAQTSTWLRDYSVKSPPAPLPASSSPSSPSLPSMTSTTSDTNTGWLVSNLPAGFKKVMEMMRFLTGRPQPVAHLVFSDGLAHVSVFAEQSQLPGKLTAAGSSDESPTSFAVRTVADHQITVMGEVPLATVQAIADGVTRTRADRPVEIDKTAQKLIR